MKDSFYQKILLVLFGIFLAVLALEAGLRVSGFIILSIQEYKNQQALKHDGAYKIMCIGESTTAGQYPRFLGNVLAKNIGDIKVSVIDKGIPGTNTSVMVEQLESYLNSYNPRAVVAMIGINDKGIYEPVEVSEDLKADSTWKSLRVYKLARLLKLHIAVKTKEAASAQEHIVEPEVVQNKTDNQKEQRYIKQIQFLQERGRLAEADKLLLKVIKLNPNNGHAFAMLGWGFSSRGKTLSAIIYFDKSLKLSPHNPWVLIGLGLAYRKLHNYGKAEVVLKEAIAITPQDDWPYLELINCYFEEGRYQSAQVVQKAGIEHCLRKDKLYGVFEALQVIAAKNSVAENDNSAAKQSAFEYYSDATKRNYRIIKDKLDHRGIRLVCVQYPMRSIIPLKQIFTEKDNIVFVDNEQIFKTAVKEDGFWAYFGDMFGGDFGHCTEKGNKLLAENIAKVISKEVFGKRN